MYKDINWNEIITNEDTIEISLLVTEFEICYKRGPKDLFKNRNYYTGICNYAIWGSKQIAPYKSIHPSESIEKAFNTSLEGILNFDNKDDSNENLFWVNGDKVVDGNGDIFTLEEAKEKRKQCNNH